MKGFNEAKNFRNNLAKDLKGIKKGNILDRTKDLFLSEEEKEKKMKERNQKAQDTLLLEKYGRGSKYKIARHIVHPEIKEREDAENKLREEKREIEREKYLKEEALKNENNIKKMKIEFQGDDSYFNERITQEIQKQEHLKSELEKSQSELKRLETIQRLRKGEVNDISHDKILLLAWDKDFSNDQKKKNEDINFYEMMKEKYKLESTEDLGHVSNGHGGYSEATAKIQEIYSDPETNKRYKVTRVSVHGDSWSSVADAIHDDVLRIKVEEI